MIEPRLASSVQISALIRLARAEGHFAAILRKGDPESGAILVIGLVRGANPVMFERFPGSNGSHWQRSASSGFESESDITERWKKRASNDPDLWVIELDVASSERLDRILTAVA